MPPELLTTDKIIALDIRIRKTSEGRFACTTHAGTQEYALVLLSNSSDQPSIEAGLLELVRHLKQHP